MIPIGLILGGISAALSLFTAAKNASDAATRGRGRGGGGRMQQGMGGMGGQMGLPKGALQIPKFNPQQMQGLNEILSMGLGGLRQNQPSFAPIAQAARSRFSTETLPLIAERFGSLNARRSGAFEGTLAGAGRQFEENLAGMEQGFNQQNINQLLQMLAIGTQSPYETVYKKRQPGFGENAAVAAIPALIQNAPELYKMFSDWGGGGSGTTPAITGGK